MKKRYTAPAYASLELGRDLCDTIGFGNGYVIDGSEVESNSYTDSDVEFDWYKEPFVD